MATQDKDEPAPPPPAALGEILRRAYADDYHADLRFELISLLLVLAHDARDAEARRVL
ncbi:MAG: hypothetical protein ABIS51_03665 [Sphingomonas sp.]